MNSFRLEFDRDYGISRRTGWSVSINGIVVCQFRSLAAALCIAVKEAFARRREAQNRQIQKT